MIADTAIMLDGTIGLVAGAGLAVVHLLAVYRAASRVTHTGRGPAAIVAGGILRVLAVVAIFTLIGAGAPVRFAGLATGFLGVRLAFSLWTVLQPAPPQRNLAREP